jgi:hypothetical protein
MGALSEPFGDAMRTNTIPNEPRRRLWRSRWAAIGAAVVVTFGGGGLFVANAASSLPSSVVTIDPVRILDTRTDVGLPGPFVSAVSQKLQVTGLAVPAGSTGVLLNVTVVRPTAAGFLSVRPGDATGAPSTSSLNFIAGDIVPNSVQLGLPTTGANAGQIDITYDAFGQAGPTTEVLIDVVGYMVAGGGGATGPAGPAGPGAQLVDVPISPGGILAVGTFEGVNIRAICNPGQTGLFFNTTVGFNSLRLGGIAFIGNVPSSIDVVGASGYNFSPTGGPPLNFSLLAANTTQANSLQVELHITYGSPCNVWGSIVPVG